MALISHTARLSYVACRYPPFASHLLWPQPPASLVSRWQLLPPAKFFFLLFREVQTFLKTKVVKIPWFSPVKILASFF